MNTQKSKIKFVRTLCLALLMIFMTIPLYVPESYIRVIIIANYIAIFALSWNMLSGYIGYISFGHTLLIAIAGYVSAILSYPPQAWPRSFFHLGLPLYVTIPIGVALATLAGSVFFIPGLKTRGPYFVLVTLASNVVGEGIATISGDIGGATRGLFGFPVVFERAAPNFYLSLVLMLIIAFISWYVVRSDIGLLLKAISMDEICLSHLGKSVLKLKAICFFLSAFAAGIGGAFYYHYIGSISPHSAFSFFLLMQIIISVVIGGTGTIIGPIIGAFIVTFMLEGMRPLFPGTIAPGRVLAYLIIGLIIYLAKPQGLYRFIKARLGVSK